MQRAFPYNLYELDVKFSFCDVVWRTLTQGHIQFLLWVRTWDWVRSHVKRIEINAKKSFKKGTFILIGRDVFVALTVVVAKSPYIYSWMWQFHFGSLQTWKSMIRIFWTNWLTSKTLQNLQGIGFTLDFGFKIYGDFTKSAPFNSDSRPHFLKNDKTNPITKLAGFLINPEKLYVALLYYRWLTHSKFPHSVI